MSDAIGHVVIVGGGSAGWLTAAVIAAEHRSTSASGLQVTLLESPDVRDHRRRRRHLADACATPCAGSGSARPTSSASAMRRSSRARSSRAGRRPASDDHYYHPFVLPQGYTETNLVAGWLQRHADVPFAELVSFQPHLCDAGQGAQADRHARIRGGGQLRLPPRRRQVRRVPAPALRRAARRAARARPRDRRRRRTTTATSPRCRRASTARSPATCSSIAPACRRCCSASTTASRFVSQQARAVQRRALALQVPYADPDSPDRLHRRISTAQRSGWIWDIGLPTRRGIGHVYSSAHTTDDAAETAAAALHRRQRRARAGHAARRASSSFEPGYRDEVLASQLRGDRPVQRLHRAAGSLVAGAGRTGRRRCSSDQMPATRADDGHRRPALQRDLQLPLGARRSISSSCITC